MIEVTINPTNASPEVEKDYRTGCFGQKNMSPSLVENDKVNSFSIKNSTPEDNKSSLFSIKPQMIEFKNDHRA